LHASICYILHAYLIFNLEQLRINMQSEVSFSHNIDSILSTLTILKTRAIVLCKVKRGHLLVPLLALMCLVSLLSHHFRGLVTWTVQCMRNLENILG